MQNKLQGANTARNQVIFNDLNIDQGPLDLSLNQIKINHPRNRNSKLGEDSKLYSTVTPSNESNQNGTKFGGQFPNRLGKMKDVKGNITSEIYV